MTEAATRDATAPTLVARCLAGDGGAWNALVDRHAALVWSIATRAGLSREDASDVFQNTWTVAIEELGRLRDPERFGAWIAQVARHQSLRVRRGYGIARKAREKVAREDLDDRLPDETLERLEQRDRLTNALGRIGARCADLLGALYFDDPRPAYTEIAERLGLRIGSIGPTRARCFDKLRRELGETS